jgi:hypothetical protein
VGWRTIRFDVAQPVSRSLRQWVREFREFTVWHGTDTMIERGHNEAVTHFEITLEGNSGFLNAMTPEFAAAAIQIASDIDPIDPQLRELARGAATQLQDQIVRRDGDGIIVPPRAGREVAERAEGEASLPVLRQELALHYDRVQAALRRLNNVTGPKAWHRRIELMFALRVDALATLNCVRRIERIASDLSGRFNGNDHIAAARQVFGRESEHVTDLRDMSEHIDEYVIGTGRLDRGQSVEPGQVFEISAAEGDVSISARGRKVNISVVVAAAERLAKCAEATTSARLLTLTFPGLAGVDFGKMESDGRCRVLAQEELSEDQLFARTKLDELRAGASGFLAGLGPCPHCGRPL